MNQLVLSVLNSLVYAVPLLLIIFVVTKIIANFIDKRSTREGKKNLRNGQGFINLYIGTVIVVGLLWIVATALVNNM